MYTLRRRGLAARAGIMIAAIGAIAALALPGAGAATSAASHATSADSHTRLAGAHAKLTAAAASPSHTTCVDHGQGTTCTGTYSGDNAYDPWVDQWRDPNSKNQEQISHPPVVTVSQTKNLRDQVIDVNWQYFTPTLTRSGDPNPVGSAENYEVSIFECKGTNLPVNAQGLDGSCYEVPVGGQEPGQTGLPNALLENHASAGITLAPGATGHPDTYGWGSNTCPPASPVCKPPTGGDPSTWKGHAQFHIEAGIEGNSKLGCDIRTSCSLVVVPNFGGNWTPDHVTNQPSRTDTSDCENHFYDDPLNGGIGENNAWNAFACELMDRIVVPLSFARTPANCPQRPPAFSAEGAAMMSRAMTQWQSGWCIGQAPVSFAFTQIPESQARDDFLQGGQALAAGVDMTVATLPPDAGAAQASSRKFTYAPLANTGAAIANFVDDRKDGRQLNRVVLNQRLGAKLTTESYSLRYGCTVTVVQPPWKLPPAPSDACDPAVSHNPTAIFGDQEFLSLNKDCRPTLQAANYVCDAGDFTVLQNDEAGDFLPTVPSGDSDMTYQFTNWIGASADATGFLHGAADQWGMHLNNNYLNAVSYPAQSLQLLDPGTKWPLPVTCGNPPNCQVNASVENATMNVRWNFVTGLDNVANNLLQFKPNAQDPTLQCPSTIGTCLNVNEMDFPAMPAEPIGARGLFSELDLGRVNAYEFPATALVNAAGKAVAPTQASVTAAVKDMKTNPDGITQYANLASKDPAAYPLAMVDYAMVPTCGLSPSKAAAVADFLTKVATTGQQSGITPGSLAPGYYPLTSAQRAQTLKAAHEVKVQDCKSAPLDHTISGHDHPSTVSHHGGAGGTGAAGAGAGAGQRGGTSGKGANGAEAKGGTSGSPSASGSAQARTVGFGQKSPDSGLPVWLLLLVIIAGGVVLVGGPTAWAVTATGKWPVVARYTRHAWAWAPPAWARLHAARIWRP